MNASVSSFARFVSSINLLHKLIFRIFLCTVQKNKQSLKSIKKKKPIDDKRNAIAVVERIREKSKQEKEQDKVESNVQRLLRLSQAETLHKKLEHKVSLRYSILHIRNPILIPASFRLVDRQNIEIEKQERMRKEETKKRIY